MQDTSKKVRYYQLSAAAQAATAPRRRLKQAHIALRVATGGLARPSPGDQTTRLPDELGSRSRCRLRVSRIGKLGPESEFFSTSRYRRAGRSPKQVQNSAPGFLSNASFIFRAISSSGFFSVRLGLGVTGTRTAARPECRASGAVR